MTAKLISMYVLSLFAAITPADQPLINSKALTIKQRFNPPKSYERVNAAPGSFGEYLQTLKLKPNGSDVLLYDGSKKSNKVHEAVLTIDVGKADLQQCADAVMRLRAEYLFARREYSKIHFNFTNGFNASYDKWASGYRIKVKGNNVSWYKTNDSSHSYASFRKYLDVVFMYAGTLSLSKELKKIDRSAVQTGDVLIHGGSPGHAVIVVDVAKDASGRKIFMIAQSYMPAQEIHILKNPDNSRISPWYEVATDENEIRTPEWVFSATDWKRFVD